MIGGNTGLQVLHIETHVWMNEWMDWAIDTMDLTQELILESAQEYQDDDFFRYAGCVGPNLSSDPANLLSNGATINAAKIGRPTGRSRMPSYQSGTMPLT